MVYKRPLVLFFVKSYLEALFEAQLDCYHRLQNVFIYQRRAIFPITTETKIYFLNIFIRNVFMVTTK